MKLRIFVILTSLFTSLNLIGQEVEFIDSLRHNVNGLVLSEKVDSILSKKVGTEAMYFKLPKLNGDSISLNELKGKVVLIEFWDPTLKPCWRIIKDLIVLDSLYKDNNFEIISIITVTPKKKIRKKLEAYLQKNNATYNILIGNSQIAGMYSNMNSNPSPVFYLINKNGVITYAHFGTFYLEKLNEMKNEINKIIY